MKITEPEFTEVAAKLATVLKAARLNKLPGMDSVAVALNARPTHDEHMHAKNIMRVLEDLGYEIHKKG